MLEDGVNKFRRFIDQRLEDPTNNDNDIDDEMSVADDVEFDDIIDSCVSDISTDDDF